MKTKFNNQELCHVWASRSQSEGKNANGSFYFEGDTIYSYGPHFPIASFVDDDTVLMTNQSYSNTTAKHIANVRWAITHKKIFYVDDVMANVNIWDVDRHVRLAHISNFKKLTDEIDDTLARASRARSNKVHLLGSALWQIEHAQEYADFFHINDEYDVSEYLGHIDVARIREDKELLDSENERKAEIKRKEAYIKNIEHIKAWKNGEDVHIPYGITDVMLRVKDDVIETSHHANIPLTQAKKLWPLIKRCKDNSQSYQPKTRYEIGLYLLTEIKHNGDVKIGCHYIKYNELEKIAKQLELV